MALRIVEQAGRTRRRAPAQRQRGLARDRPAVLRGRRRDGRRQGGRGGVGHGGRGLREASEDARARAARRSSPGSSSEANRRIYELAVSDESTAAWAPRSPRRRSRASEVSLAHVGDSRAYRLRDGELEQLTRDHSLVAELERSGQITAEAAEHHPQRSIITRALGPEPDVEVDTYTISGRDGDLFLICSDGLTSMISDDEVGVDPALGRRPRGGGRGARPRGQPERRPRQHHRRPVPSRATATRRGRRRAARRRRDHRRADQRGRRCRPRLRRRSPRPARPGPAPWPKRPGRRSARRHRGGLARSGRSPLPRRRRAAAAAARSACSGGSSVLVLLAAVVAGLYALSRQVYFVGTNDAGLVTLYRGVPYELPFGDRPLRARSTPAECRPARFPARRRERVLDHEWRGREDAVDLLRALERGQLLRLMSARTRELFGLLPVSLLVAAGFAAVLATRTEDVSDATLTYGAVFLGPVRDRPPVHPRAAARRRPLHVPAGRAAGRRRPGGDLPDRRRAGARAGAVVRGRAGVLLRHDPARPRPPRARALPLHDRGGLDRAAVDAAPARDRRAGERGVPGHQARADPVPAGRVRQARNHHLPRELPARDRRHAAAPAAAPAALRAPGAAVGAARAGHAAARPRARPRARPGRCC